MSESPGDPIVLVHTDEDERGSARYIQSTDAAVTVARFELHRSWRWEAHEHEHHQFLWAPDGAVTIQTEDIDWLAPPTIGLWVPAGVRHSAGSDQPFRLYSLYFEPADCPFRWEATTPLAVTPLARELIIHLDNPELAADARERAQAVLYDCLAPLSLATLQIPMPADPRARQVAESILANPGDGRDLAHWAQQVGAGERTLTRVFTAETGMPFTQWRLHVRVRAAMQLLATGTSVGVTARTVGYRTASAFVQAFSRVTGSTPAAWAAEAAGERDMPS
ncbi:MAG: helix-turn-helix transcriptional regulator [Actinomycetota bacterium]|jgi:AraC-like DNA-binding protein/quercetin dioxygenase-like cupin family protein